MTNPFFRRFPHYAFAAVLLLVLAALQTSGAVTLFGIVPNLALGALIALLFYFDSFAGILLLSALAAAALNWTSGIPRELIAFLSAVSAAFVLKRLSRWHFALDVALLAGSAAVIFALLADPSYPFSFPARFGVELLYTELAAFFFLGFLSSLYGAPQTSRT